MYEKVYDEPITPDPASEKAVNLKGAKEDTGVISWSLYIKTPGSALVLLLPH